MYLLGMALYTIASLGSGLAPSFPWLLGSRALQGIGIDADAASNNGDHRRIFSPENEAGAVDLGRS